MSNGSRDQMMDWTKRGTLNQSPERGTYAACLLRRSRFCCLSSFISSSLVQLAMSWSMLNKLRSAGMSKRAFFFLIPPSRRGEKPRGGGVLGLMRLGPGRESISCWLKAIQSEWVCGDMGCSATALGKTALGRTFVSTGSPWNMCCWG